MRECDAILLLADDPVALIDIPALADANGWSVVILDKGSHHNFQLSKSGR
jgi:tRNA 2-thiouridine synthesizing protein A